jgi:hypothetical protein
VLRDISVQYMNCLLLIYFNNKTLHVSSRLAAHHQEDRLCINSNWYSHAAASHHSLSFMKNWTCGSSPRSGPRNAWTLIKNVNGASCLSKFWYFYYLRNPNDFLSQFVTMEETWLYHYDPVTKQQSMEWWHSGSPSPKKSAGKVLASIFRNQGAVGQHLDEQSASGTPLIGGGTLAH